MPLNWIISQTASKMRLWKSNTKKFGWKLSVGIRLKRRHIYTFAFLLLYPCSAELNIREHVFSLYKYTFNINSVAAHYITSISSDRIEITSSVSFFVVWLRHQFTILFIKIVLIILWGIAHHFIGCNHITLYCCHSKRVWYLQVVGMQLFHTNGSMFSIPFAY